VGVSPVISLDQHFSGFASLSRADDAIAFHDLNHAGSPIISHSETTLNHGDRRLRFKDFQFNQGLDPSLFMFGVPKGADVLQLEGE